MENTNNETKKIEKKMNQFVVIGLGRFGKSVATALANHGKQVLVIDTNREVVNQIESQVSGAVVADATGNNVLYSLGVQNFDCVINCIGGNLQASILVTYICKELGINYVVARSNTEQNKKILEKIGADMVVYPEVFMGKKIANILSNPSMNEIFNLADNFKIVEVPVPDNWQNKTVVDLDVRKKYKVSIIFIKRADTVITVEPETQMLAGDILILAGESKPLANISNMTSEVIDTGHSLQDGLEAVN